MNTKKQILELIEKGEKQAEIARKFGVSKQYVSQVKKEFLRVGDIYKESTKGRPKTKSLLPSEIKALDGFLKDWFRDDPQREISIDDVSNWVIETFKKRISKTQLRRFCYEREIYPSDPYKGIVQDYEFEEDYYKWLESDVAKKIREKEAEFKKQQEAEKAEKKALLAESEADAGSEIMMPEDYDEMAMINKETIRAMVPQVPLRKKKKGSPFTKKKRRKKK
jgi:hypothetical protein